LNYTRIKTTQTSYQPVISLPMYFTTNRLSTKPTKSVMVILCTKIITMKRLPLFTTKRIQHICHI